MAVLIEIFYSILAVDMTHVTQLSTIQLTTNVSDTVYLTPMWAAHLLRSLRLLMDAKGFISGRSLGCEFFRLVKPAQSGMNAVGIVLDSIGKSLFSYRNGHS